MCAPTAPALTIYRNGAGEAERVTPDRVDAAGLVAALDEDPPPEQSFFLIERTGSDAHRDFLQVAFRGSKRDWTLEIAHGDRMRQTRSGNASEISSLVQDWAAGDLSVEDCSEWTDVSRYLG